MDETQLKISADDTIGSACAKMSDGDIGALGVCLKLSKQPDGLLRLLDADDMGIRGSSIWIGYKDFAGESIEVFAKALHARDQSLIDKIRACGGQAWSGGRS